MPFPPRFYPLTLRFVIADTIAHLLESYVYKQWCTSAQEYTRAMNFVAFAVSEQRNYRLFDIGLDRFDAVTTLKELFRPVAPPSAVVSLPVPR